MKLHTFIVCGCFVSALHAPMSGASLFQPKQGINTVSQKEPRIKVLLEKEAPSAFLEACGSFRVVSRDNGVALSGGYTGKRFVVHAIQDGLRWGEEYPDVYQISVIPKSPETTFLVNGIQYKGAISIFRVKDNKIAIVNELAIEDFVKSVMSAKYEENLGEEAMSALAIATRTEAYSKVLQGKSKTRPWDVAATDVSYFGLGVIRSKSAAEDAVNSTHHLVFETSSGLPEIVTLKPAKAREMAQKGYDAYKILKTADAKGKITSAPSQGEITRRYR